MLKLEIAERRSRPARRREALVVRYVRQAIRDLESKPSLDV